MKKVSEIRRNNLLIAIDRMGTATRLAEEAGVSSAYLSQVKNESPESKTKKAKGMGDDVARKIEKALGEPVGWMDAEHANGAPQPRESEPSSVKDLIALIHLWESAPAEGKKFILESAQSVVSLTGVKQNKPAPPKVEVEPISPSEVSPRSAQPELDIDPRVNNVMENFKPRSAISSDHVKQKKKLTRNK